MEKVEIESGSSSSYSVYSNALELVQNNTSKILAVDDEAFNILVIKGLMRVLGMQDIESRVDCCYNGE
jgi:hypothetical protein